MDHHGSTYSSNTTYVATLSAEVSIISVGKHSFGHPDATVVSRWDSYGELLQIKSPTDNASPEGDITITTTGVGTFTTSTSSSGRTFATTMDS